MEENSYEFSDEIKKRQSFYTSGSQRGPYGPSGGHQVSKVPDENYGKLWATVTSELATEALLPE
jgi:hypothetical protein